MSSIKVEEQILAARNGDIDANLKVAEYFIKQKFYEEALSYLNSALKFSQDVVAYNKDKIRARIAEVEKMMEADKK